MPTQFFWVTTQEIFSLFPHTVPVLGTTPVRIFARWLQETDPVLKAHFREQLFAFLEASTLISCPSLHVARRQEFFGVPSKN